MKGYWIIRVNVIERDGFNEYLVRSKPEIEKSGGKYLVRGGQCTTISGESFERHVVIEFESYQSALDFYHSKEYTAIKKYRENSAKFNLVIIEGA